LSPADILRVLEGYLEKSVSVVSFVCNHEFQELRYTPLYKTDSLPS
jgi:hypothetical protein